MNTSWSKEAKSKTHLFIHLFSQSFIYSMHSGTYSVPGSTESRDSQTEANGQYIWDLWGGGGGLCKSRAGGLQVLAGPGVGEAGPQCFQLC